MRFRLCLLGLLIAPLSGRAAHAQTACPATCAGFVAPAGGTFGAFTRVTAAIYADDTFDNDRRRSTTNALVASCVGGELRSVTPATATDDGPLFFVSVGGEPSERGQPIAFRYCSPSDTTFAPLLTPQANAENTPTLDERRSIGSPAIPYRLRVASADLPVELVAFDAVADGQGVRLTWQTASETNNAGFAVELRRADAEAFEAVAFVPGAGTTLEARTYAYRVSGLAPGVYRFRLRQRDLDGATELGPEVALTLAPTTAFHVGGPHPNPSRGAATLTITPTRPQHVRVDLYDVLGAHVARLHDGEVDGTLRLATPDGQAPGVYVIRMVGERYAESRSFVVLR